jgi:hypothetical protein
MEHETLPFKGTRISFIVFTHNACEELTEDVVAELQELGFTACSTDRQRDPGNVDENDFDSFYAKHVKDNPPPKGKGMVAIECAGYACGRGTAWISFDTGSAPNKGKGKTKGIDAAVAASATTKKNSAGKGSKKKDPQNLGLTGVSFETARISGSVLRLTFPKNRVGLHVVELTVNTTTGFLNLVAARRFDLYNRTTEATAEFSTWVDSLATGTVVLIAISDTAIAKKRPMEAETYDALRQLGGADDMDVIGYRNPFVFMGAKGLPQGKAQMLLDKRSQSKTVLRLDGRMIAKTCGASSVTITDVKNTSISAKDSCPDREAQGYIFKNCQTHIVKNGKLHVHR